MKRPLSEGAARWTLSVAIVIVLALNLALWGHGLHDKIVVEGAGLVWLVVLWLPVTRRPPGVQELVSLIAFAGFSAAVWKHVASPAEADGWIAFAVIAGIGQFWPLGRRKVT